MSTMRFDDAGYVRDFVEKGEFPLIHKDITKMIAKHAAGKRCAFDFGACTGLLSIAAQRAGVQNVLGLEASAMSLAIAPMAPGVAYRKFKVEHTNLAPLRELVRQYRPEVAIMRRVLPEISGGQVSGARHFITALHEGGVELLIIEGRIKSARSVHPLAGIDEEIAVCAGLYEVVERYRNVAVLKRQ